MRLQILRRPSDTLRSLAQPVNPVDKAKMDSEYTALMAELGEGPAPGPRFGAPQYVRKKTVSCLRHFIRLEKVRKISTWNNLNFLFFNSQTPDR